MNVVGGVPLTWTKTNFCFFLKYAYMLKEAMYKNKNILNKVMLHSITSCIKSGLLLLHQTTYYDRFLEPKIKLKWKKVKTLYQHLQNKQQKITYLWSHQYLPIFRNSNFLLVEYLMKFLIKALICPVRLDAESLDKWSSMIRYVLNTPPSLNMLLEKMLF